MLRARLKIDSQNEAGGTGNTSTQTHGNKLVYNGMKE
jgi:hypothetical protein